MLEMFYADAACLPFAKAGRQSALCTTDATETIAFVPII